MLDYYYGDNLKYEFTNESVKKYSIFTETQIIHQFPLKINATHQFLLKTFDNTKTEILAAVSGNKLYRYYVTTKDTNKSLKDIELEEEGYEVNSIFGFIINNGHYYILIELGSSISDNCKNKTLLYYFDFYGKS